MNESSTDARSLIGCTTTVANRAQAEEIAHSLIKYGLAACVQVEGPLSSYYFWQGKMHCENEFRLTIKTSLSVWPNLKNELQRIHPYDEPQIIAIPIMDASDGYRDWVIQQTNL